MAIVKIIKTKYFTCLFIPQCRFLNFLVTNTAKKVCSFHYKCSCRALNHQFFKTWVMIWRFVHCFCAVVHAHSFASFGLCAGLVRLATASGFYILVVFNNSIIKIFGLPLSIITLLIQYPFSLWVYLFWMWYWSLFFFW